MARFKRLTAAEARQLTRRELLGRIEAEQGYWHHGHRDRRDPDGYREFCQIRHAYLGAAGIVAAMQDLIDYIEGRGPGRYWDTRPCDDEPAPPGGGAARIRAARQARQELSTPPGGGP